MLYYCSLASYIHLDTVRLAQKDDVMWEKLKTEPKCLTESKL